MIRIRFNDLDSRKRASGRLNGRSPFRCWATGEMLVPEAAPGFLATRSLPPTGFSASPARARRTLSNPAHSGRAPRSPAGVPPPHVHDSPAAPRTVKVTPRLVSDLVAVVGPENVLDSRDETLVYECDGYVVEKSVPGIVVFPTSTEQAVEVVKLCRRHDIPFVPRGAGTSLAGDTLTVGGGVMICLTRMKRILEVSLRDRYAIVEAPNQRLGAALYASRNVESFVESSARIPRRKTLIVFPQRLRKGSELVFRDVITRKVRRPGPG